MLLLAALIEKLKNWGKRSKIGDPQVELMHQKYVQQGDLGREAQCSPKHRRTMKATQVTEEARQALEKHWQMLKGLCSILPIAIIFTEFNSKLRNRIPKLMVEVRDKVSAFPRIHTLRQVTRDIPYIEEDDIELDYDLHIVGAVAALAYLLLATVKKAIHQHKYILDICSNGLTSEDVINATPHRYQLFIQIFRTVVDRQKIVLHADKVAICSCSSVSKAVGGLWTLFCLPEVECRAVVSTALEFIQMAGLVTQPRQPHTTAVDLLRKLNP